MTKSHPILGKLAFQNRPYRAAHPRMAIGGSAPPGHLGYICPHAVVSIIAVASHLVKRNLINAKVYSDKHGTYMINSLTQKFFLVTDFGDRYWSCPVA